MENTIKPRLLEAGADCNRMLVIDESIDCLSMTDERLVQAVKEDSKITFSKDRVILPP